MLKEDWELVVDWLPVIVELGNGAGVSKKIKGRVLDITYTYIYIYIK